MKKNKGIIVFCNLCNQEINMDKDDYCKHEDLRGKKHVGIAYYHNKCFHNMLSKMQEKVMSSIMSSIPYITKEVKKQIEVMQ